MSNKPDPDALFSETDRSELKRFRNAINNIEKASRVEIVEEPVFNRDLNVYGVHLWAPPPTPADVAQDSFYFNSKEAAVKAVEHAKSFLPKE